MTSADKSFIIKTICTKIGFILRCEFTNIAEIQWKREAKMNVIEFKNFNCYYKSKKEYFKALSDLNLTVDEGEFLVVVGESGCGKTTLLKACLGMADYYDGELFIDGGNIENIDLKSGKFAFIRQEIALYPSMTVYENIAFPLRAMRTSQAEVDKRVKEISELIGMRNLLTRKPKQLSGGQQQRVAIGRALVKNPSFIFFDEPFSNIDASLRKDVRMLVKQIHSQIRPTIVFVTHDLTEAFFLADRIVVLKEGKVIETGTPEELGENGKSDLIRAFLGKPLMSEWNEI